MSATALCARTCRFPETSPALVSSLRSLVSGLWSWVLGPGSWVLDPGSRGCSLGAATPILSGCLGLSRGGPRDFFPIQFSVFSRTSSWTLSGRQNLHKGSQNRSQNGPKIVPNSLRRRGRKKASNLDRFGNHFSLIFDRFSSRFLVSSATRFEVVFQNSASQKYRKT